jgi:hypothetical protein
MHVNCLTYCDRFDDTSDMNAATQRLGTDSSVFYATVFRIHKTEKYKSIATQYTSRTDTSMATNTGNC